MMKNDEFLKMLPTLTKEQWKQAKAWEARYRAEKLADDDNAKLILELINKELGLSVPYSAIKAPWIVNASKAAYFIDTTFPKIKKLVRIALFKMCLGFIVDDLKARNIPVSFGTLWEHLVRVPQLFDQQFPDYRKSGL